LITKPDLSLISSQQNKPPSFPPLTTHPISISIEHPCPAPLLSSAHASPVPLTVLAINNVSSPLLSPTLTAPKLSLILSAVSHHLSPPALFGKISPWSSLFPFSSTAIPLLSRAKQAPKPSAAKASEAPAPAKESDAAACAKARIPVYFTPPPADSPARDPSGIRRCRRPAAPRERWRLSEAPPGVSRRFLLAPTILKRRHPGSSCRSRLIQLRWRQLGLGLDSVCARSCLLALTRLGSGGSWLVLELVAALIIPLLGALGLERLGGSRFLGPSCYFGSRGGVFLNSVWG